VQLSIFDKPKPKLRARFIPRDYQERGINESFRLWQDHVGVICRQPTGSGKTVVGSMIADRWLQQGDDYRVLVLAHERQLIQQFSEEINDVLGIKPKIEMGNEHCTGREQIIVASRQTLYVKGKGDEAISRLYKFDTNLKWLLIIDEAHRWARKLPSCRPIIEYFEQNEDHRRLGLSATPERTDKVTLKGLFSGIANDYRLYDVDGGPCAVNDGWAVPYDQRFIMVEGVDFKNIKEIAKDFDKHELERILGESETLAKLCTPLLDLVGRKRTIVFNPGTAMAKNVALYLNAKMGYECAVSVDGSYPDEARKDIYRRHQRGEFQFLSVCGLCREGYNDPGIQAVAVFRPTKSRPLAEQMKGRGCRPLRGVVSSEMTPEERLAAIKASDKPSCLIVDLVGITGITDCASTASIMAESKPDEVIERANQNLVKGEGPTDVGEAIRKAERDLESEREAARLARLERLRIEQEEADKRAKLLAEVRYSQHRVNSGGGGKVRTGKGEVEPATVSQLRYMRYLGFKSPTEGLSKKQASGIIAKLKSGQSPEHVAKVTPTAPREKSEPRRLSLDEINSLFMESR
jgi:superfamily II DNA or RNA helicase